MESPEDAAGGADADLLEAFAAEMSRPGPEVALDRAALLVAAQARPTLDLDAQLARLDDLAASCPTPTLDALARHLFADLGFRGNLADYYDPHNSYLDWVIRRRTGIPITLAIVTMEVGRRVGVPLAGVSMPGHFLLRDRVDPEVFVDPFAGGRFLDRSGCERIFRGLQGPVAHLADEHLEPVDAHTILLRMLANLKAIFAARGDVHQLRWVLALRERVPGAPPDDHRELVSALAGRGRFDLAADELERRASTLESEGDDGSAADLRDAAIAFRARLN